MEDYAKANEHSINHLSGYDFERVVGYHYLQVLFEINLLYQLFYL